MTKKIICITIAALTVLSMSGCTIISRQKADSVSAAPPVFTAEPLQLPVASTAQEDQEEEVPEDSGEARRVADEYPTLAEDDPLYPSVAAVYQGLIPIFRYFAFEGEDYDLANLKAEDFWLLMAMTAASVNEGETDQTGDISLPWETITDYAMTFFGAYYDANGIPDWKDSYSAYSDPRSKVVSLSAMTIDGYEGSMVGFWAGEEEEGAYETVLEISWDVLDPGENSGENKVSSTKRWKLTLKPWNDEGEHIFDYKLAGYEPVNEDSAN